MPPKKTKRQEESDTLQEEVKEEKLLKKAKKGSKPVEAKEEDASNKPEKKPSRSSSRKKKEVDEEAEEETKIEVKTKKVTKKAATKKGKEVKEESEEEEEEVAVTTKSKGGRMTKEMARQKSVDSYVAVEINHPTGDGKFDKDKILISSWNVNGLRAVLNRNDVQKYVQESGPDILCLNETKVDEEQIPSVSKWVPSDYTAYFNACKTSKGYAGTAILTKVKPISVKHDIGSKKHDLEGRTITLEFEHFYIVSCYVPNAGQKLERLDYRTKEWDLDFRDYLNGLKAKKHVILCGDLNVAHEEIDIHNPKGNLRTAGFTKEERQGFTNFLHTGWIDTFRHFYPKEQKFSYWSARFNNRATNKGWRLDYFVVDKEAIGGVKDSIINGNIMGSDHCPIELIYNPNFV